MPSVIRASNIGDAAIIKSIINILSNEGIKVISSIYFNPELSLKKGNYTKTQPSKNDNKSIEKAKNYFNKINSLDHIQALVVKDKKRIAKEGRQGTKKMLSKVKKNSKGVLNRNCGSIWPLYSRVIKHPMNPSDKGSLGR